MNQRIMIMKFRKFQQFWAVCIVLVEKCSHLQKEATERLWQVQLLTSAAPWRSAVSTLPEGLILTLVLSPLLEWLAVGLSVYPWEEVHRGFSLIGTMHFRTARDILMASQISVGNHTFYQVQLYNNEQAFQSLSVTGSLDCCMCICFSLNAPSLCK